MQTIYALPVTGLTFAPYLIGGIALIVAGAGAWVASKFRS